MKTIESKYHMGNAADALDALYIRARKLERQIRDHDPDNACALANIDDALGGLVRAEMAFRRLYK